MKVNRKQFNMLLHRHKYIIRWKIILAQFPLFVSKTKFSLSWHDSCSPTELLYGCCIHTNYEPAHCAAPRVQHTAPEHSQNYQLEWQLPKFCGPYQLHNLVQVQLPHVPKGSIPFLEKQCITADNGAGEIWKDDVTPKGGLVKCDTWWQRGEGVKMWKFWVASFLNAP